MDTWWIDEPSVLGSENPSTEDLERLRARGFEVVISLLREHEQRPRYDVGRVLALGYVRHNIPVQDFHAPDLAQLEEFVDLIARLPPGAKVVVHCQAGIGRTGTFAAAYWITKGLPAGEAIQRIRHARQYAVETDEQVTALEEFARDRERQPSRPANPDDQP
jgi:atypical dual specificity phosphatase